MNMFENLDIMYDKDVPTGRSALHPLLIDRKNVSIGI